nr:hypothetical protein LTR18_002326 [Exophiala xenobiotica]
MPDDIVATVDLVRNLIEVIEDGHPQPPILFIDLEGVNLSRHGSIAIMQVLIPPDRKAYLVDIHILKARAFETSSTRGLTLKTILESRQFPKIRLDSAIDSQLLEFATRRVRGKFVKGLTKCISEDNTLSWTQSHQWREDKEAGRKSFAPERRGRYEVFLQRPLPPEIVLYCTQDVLYMPRLLLSYARRLQPGLAFQIQSETVNRILLSQSPHFNGEGKHMAIGPIFA